MSRKDQERCTRDAGDAFDIGYCKPPVGTRFQKGHSGNPRGRPKASETPAAMLQRLLACKITVTENGRERRVTRREAMMLKLVGKALGGDAKVAALLHTWTLDAGEPTQSARAACEIEGEDEVLLQALLGRSSRYVVDTPAEQESSAVQSSKRQNDATDATDADAHEPHAKAAPDDGKAS